MKHAFFTDPKDQSPWNYHEWLISLLTPVQVVSLTVEKKQEVTLLVIGFSQKVRDIENSLEVKLLNDKGENAFDHLLIRPHNTQKSIASAWAINFSDIP